MLPIDPVISRHGRQFPKGALIYREGDPAREVFIIQDGNVELHMQVKGEPLCLAMLGPGDFFGELGVIENQVHSTTAQATTDTVIVTLDRNLFQKILSDNPEIGARLIRVLCHRLREANDRVLKVLSRDEEARVADALIGLDTSAAPREYVGATDDRLLLATRSGMVKSRADAIINKLIALGLLQESSEGKLKVLDTAALKDFIEYSEMKKKYDPISPDDLAQVAGMSIEEARQLTKRVIRRCLPDQQNQEFGQGLLTPLQRYLQYKMRFEFKHSADSTTVAGGDNDHEGAL
jgi:CRP/FNR family cyclic AMP-dependent transcriptional regulator